jgi:hypothetical protein
VHSKKKNEKNRPLKNPGVNKGIILKEDPENSV